MTYIYCEWVKEILEVYSIYMGQKTEILEYVGEIPKIRIGSMKVGLKLFISLKENTDLMCYLYVNEFRIAEKYLNRIENWKEHMNEIQVVCDET